ncbi:cadherin-like beta sandwich domain-containing protein [Priestia megaterium]|uniref:Cadherin-like beta sandwich domain-containing protein n=1 Tax=Priestia megaterium TaxID=1404 RepID=A0A6H1P187_PRIMG|nr:cadherin-like beta sandwich domain-containing protein [Priestia megaterium]QIZ07177.1 cadherin-like beta sandwich domain-containing protein [Priestia megaterium]
MLKLGSRGEDVGDSTVITVEQLTPFRLTGEGVEPLFYPKISIPGKAYVVINESEFVAPPEITIHAPSMILQSEKAEISVNVKDNGGGIENTTVTLDGKQAENPLVIEPISLSIGSNTIGVTVFDREGNQFSKESTFTVTIDEDHLDNVIREAGEKGLISNQGIVQSLLSSVENLQALENKVRAQSGKHIDEGVAILLLKDIEYLKGHK